MTMISAITNSSGEAAVDALRAEFGAILAQRILEAEAADFIWEGRVRERYLGQYLGDEWSRMDPYQELSRVAVLSFIARDWFAGICIVDGEGAVVDMLWKQEFHRREAAEIAFGKAR